MTRPWSVFVTQQAERDLTEAILYLRDVLRGPSAAQQLVDDFQTRIAQLRNFPSIHPLVRDERLASMGYRWVSLGNRLIFFTEDERGRAVNIERILYAHADWRSQLY